jgi:hypothetical protein
VPTYIAKERGYDKHLGIIEKGQKFEWTGKPGPWMIPVDQEMPKVPETRPIESDPIYATAKKLAASMNPLGQTQTPANDDPVQKGKK